MKKDKEKKGLIPGPVVLFGSGETSPSGRKVFDHVLKGLPSFPEIALLETPAGFELNSAQVIQRVADFIDHRLQNYRPRTVVVHARKRGTDFSPDNAELVAPLLEADMTFMGPGSPTYAVRQLKDSLAWQYLLARHRLGGAIVLASAAAIAISAYALPVYEIYKVGEDLHWQEGLDLFGLYGLPLVFIPHWNNNDGGEELDTSRCFMGQSRFASLMEMLPPDLTVLGIDEKTALVLDIQGGTCQVIGLGGVTLLHTGHIHSVEAPALNLNGTGLLEVAEQRNSHVHQYFNGQVFPLSECCPFQIPEMGAGINEEVWGEALRVQQGRRNSTQPAPTTTQAPQEVLVLAHERQAARERKDWALADALRQKIEGLGWQVIDTPQGSTLGLLKPEH